MVEFYILSCAR